MNQEHHDEQMQAARRDFQTLWHGKLLPRMRLFGIPKIFACAVLDIAWQAFRAGQKTGVADIQRNGSKV